MEVCSSLLRISRYTCIFSDHYAKQQPAIIRELNANYEIDGVYMNGWPTMQVCYCENCAGSAIPTRSNIVRR